MKNQTNSNKPTRLLHTMLRIQNKEASLSFYRDLLGMKVLRQRDYPRGKYTLIFVGYSDEASHSVIELTYNWEEKPYEVGEGFGHLALAVNDIYSVCDMLKHHSVNIIRPPGPMKDDPDELIAFIEDPDGYPIELIQTH